MKNKRTFYSIITILIALEIFLFSHISSPIGKEIGINFATIYHFGIFFMFTFFLSLSLLKKGKIRNKEILIILLISLIYAVSDEFHQLFVQGRFATIWDVLVDFAGSLCSIIFIKILKKFNKF